MDDKKGLYAAMAGLFGDSNGGNASSKPYTSLRRLGTYLYEVTFDKLPEENQMIDAAAIAGCTSYVKDGKLYNNLDWNYDEGAEFKVVVNGFEGTAILPGLNANNMDDKLIAQLPYHVSSGRNDNGIMVAAHVLFNDFEYVGEGDIFLTKVPYMILTMLDSMRNIEYVRPYLSNLKVNKTLLDAGYLMQYIVTDGHTTYVISPSRRGYELIDISVLPKITNFKWINKAILSWNDPELQDRPMGTERWSAIEDENNTLESLRFTVCYHDPVRLSEFIGINGTSKDSSEGELLAIFESARAIFRHRTRDGQTWQTMHSVVYSDKGMESLYVQEDYDKNYGDACEPKENEIEVISDMPATLNKKLYQTKGYNAVPNLPMDFNGSDYIESDGNQYLELGSYYSNASKDIIEAEFELIRLTEEIVWLFSMQPNTGTGAQYTWDAYFTDSYTKVRTGNGDHSVDIPALSVGVRYKMKIDLTNFTCTINDTTYNITHRRDADGLLHLFQRNTGVGKSCMRLYSFSITRDGNKLYDLIPAIRLADGKCGMWDISNCVFRVCPDSNYNFAHGRIIKNFYEGGTYEVIGNELVRLIRENEIVNVPTLPSEDGDYSLSVERNQKRWRNENWELIFETNESLPENYVYLRSDEMSKYKELLFIYQFADNHDEFFSSVMRLGLQNAITLVAVSFYNNNLANFKTLMIDSNGDLIGKQGSNLWGNPPQWANADICCRVRKIYAR